MNYVLDTNILVHILTGSDKGIKAKEKTQADNPFLIISIVTQAEILSIAKQRKWGDRKLSTLNDLLENLLIIPIDNDELVKTYAEIDAFSQGKLIDKPLNTSSRNMGKNDLWIATTTYLTRSTLLTTDNDFNHLSPKYFKIDNLN